MRGRKPQPTALKMLRGNPGRRALNTQEPQHDALALTWPADLVDPRARAEWDRIASQLVERGQVTTVDRAVLMAYCVKYAQWSALEHDVATQPLIVHSRRGYPKQNPAFGLANKAFELMLKAATELGITPSSRARVVAQTLEHRAAPESKWAGILK